MTKKKNPTVEAFDKEGPQNLAEGHTWCPECQAAYEGSTCPGCVDPFAASQPKQGITQETRDAIVDEAVAKGVDLDNFFPEGILDLTELTEEFGVALLTKLREVPGPGAETGPGPATENTTQKAGCDVHQFVKNEDDGSVICEKCGWVLSPEEAAKAVVEIATEGLEEMMNTETTTITEILPVPLSDPEYKEFGIKLGLANQEISQAEDELASVKSQYKARITSAEGRRNEYAAIINAGHQQKQVECHLVKDFTENTITLIRLDTGEAVRTRTMTTAERQRGLFQPPPPDPSCIDPTD